jgi:tRNA pseudouridine55 synthase
MLIEGVLPVLKPVDYTSHDVVAVVRRILKIKRIGHTGTLDPSVTGVLPLCIGRATRIVEYIQDLPKEYEAILQIGQATDTEDLSGNVIETCDEVTSTVDKLRNVISSFLGTIEQIPPMYSAVRVNGKRLYELARRGEEVERKPRQVTIHEIEILQMDLDQPFPEVKFRVLCSKGTYIRTLCVDIGRALGFPAAMKELIRTASGSIHIQDCISLSDIEQLHQNQQLEDRIIPVDQAIRHLPAYYLDQDHAERALQGQKISLSQLMPVSDLQENEEVRMYGPHDQFLGIYHIDRHHQILKPLKVFS